MENSPNTEQPVTKHGDGSEKENKSKEKKLFEKIRQHWVSLSIIFGIALGCIGSTWKAIDVIIINPMKFVIDRQDKEIESQEKKILDQNGIIEKLQKEIKYLNTRLEVPHKLIVKKKQTPQTPINDSKSELEKPGNEKLQSKVKDPNRKIEPNKGIQIFAKSSVGEIATKDGKIYRGSLDISLWPEVRNNNLVLDNIEYPVKNIQCICFEVISGETILRIKTTDTQMKEHSHKVDTIFFKRRQVIFEGVFKKKYKVEEINCLQFHKKKGGIK